MTPSPDYAPLLEKCFWFDAVESDTGLSVWGDLPDWLRGSYYIISPARFERGGRRYSHWADGDGMVARLEFTEDGVEYTSRIVRTEKVRQEEHAGSFLYRAFGTAFEGDRLAESGAIQPANNASIHWYAGRLLAFAENAPPYELNPVTLETGGEYDFGGAIPHSSALAGHPRIDRHLVNFDVSYGPGEPALRVYEFDAAGHLLRRSEYPLGGPFYVRDFGLSNQRVAFFVNAQVMDTERFRQGASVMDSLGPTALHGARILVAPRLENEMDPFWVDAGQGFCLGVVNCFDDEEQLILDVLESDEPMDQDYAPLPDLFTRASTCRAARYVIDCKAKALSHRMEMDFNHISAFPAVETACEGHYYSDFWFLSIKESARRGRKFFDELAHGNWARGYVKDIFEAPRGEYLAGAPVVVRNRNKRKNESALIVQHLIPARERSGFMIFDPQDVHAGPVARVSLKHRLHPGFHATFVPE